MVVFVSRDDCIQEVDLARPRTAMRRVVHNLRVTVRGTPPVFRLLYVVAIVTAALLVYYKTILVWGTVSPLFVTRYTRSFPPGGGGGGIGDPPAGWRPKTRVVVSLTTMPHHVHLLRPTLDSLLAQSMAPDMIYLSLPLGRNPRTNMSYDDAIAAHRVTFPDGITLLRCKDDFGPLTKLLPALETEQELARHPNSVSDNADSNTIIITVDDDQVYPPDTVKYLAWLVLPLFFSFCREKC